MAPVSHPANCPSILSVGAVDASMAVANFSCGTVDPERAIDVVAPGVNVHSSWTLPEKYNSISGTSMATPHVAGVAALLAEKYGARAWELWARLGQSARRLPLPRPRLQPASPRPPRTRSMSASVSVSARSAACA